MKTLAGHLDDLELNEVVRIIALSRRSGMLTVESPEGSAELTFLLGRLVRARVHDATEAVGDLLVRLSILTADEIAAPPNAPTETLDDAVARASRQRHAQMLPRVNEAIAEQVRSHVARVLMFRTGSFSFRVTSDEPTILRYMRDTALTLPAGIDAEELAREGKRRLLGRARDPLANMGPSHSDVDRETADQVELYVVDDDPDFRGEVERAAEGAGVIVKTLGDARTALEQLNKLEKRADPSAMIVDLVMPRSSGRGILGGLEVLQRAAEKNLTRRLYLALDADHEDAVALAQSLGVAGIVRKPAAKPGAMTERPLGLYLNAPLELLGRAPLVTGPVDLAGELREELGEGASEWRPDVTRVEESVRSLDVLKALLGELNDPSFDEEIPLLVLRFASAFFARGALFHVDKARGEITGAGGFGLGGPDPGRLVHSIRIPLAADTVFTRCLKEKAGVRQTFYESEWNLRLTGSLGGPRPRDIYTAPLLSPRGVEALLYADNGNENRAFPDIALLEIFLQQSGAALERATLVRQVRELMAAS